MLSGRKTSTRCCWAEHLPQAPVASQHSHSEMLPRLRLAQQNEMRSVPRSVSHRATKVRRPRPYRPITRPSTSKCGYSRSTPATSEADALLEYASASVVLIMATTYSACVRSSNITGSPNHRDRGEALERLDGPHERVERLVVPE